MLSSFSRFTFGSMSLGRNPAEVSNDLAVARRAMEAGVWFHSSPTYNNGFTFMVLRMAFDECPRQMPRMVIKVRDATPGLMRFEVEDTCRRLGLDGIDVAQLVSMDARPGNLADQLRGNGGPVADELASLRSRGLVRKAVLFLTPENSDAAVEAMRSGLVDGVILYWNAMQRDCSDSAWAAIRQQKVLALALRTVGGGPNDKASVAKAAQLTEFNLRLAASEPVIRTTIGGTASMGHLEEYLAAAKNPAPLPAEILMRVDLLRAAVVA